MKRTSSFYLLLLTLIAFTGCWEKDEFKEGDVISFAPKAEEVVSRASFINSTADLNHFIVWGNYDGNVVFAGQRVERVDQQWEYSPLQKWILSADQYDFSAFTPADAGIPVIVENRLTSIDVDCSISQRDLVMAYTTVPKAKIGQAVLMNFNHALAAVNFSFKLKEGFSYSNSYKIVNVKWDNIHSQGRFTLNKDNTISAQLLGNADESIAPTGITGTTLSAASAIESEYLFVVPQSLSNASLIITIEINGVTSEISKSLAVDWKAGQRYTYNVSIDPFEISVETTPWETPKVNDLIIQ